MTVRLPDEQRTCTDCGVGFALTGEEIADLDARGMGLPRRCYICRRVRKLQDQGHDYSVTNCTMCGEKTVVPFIADAGRPAYCSVCFEVIKEQRQERNR